MANSPRHLDLTPPVPRLLRHAKFLAKPGVMPCAPTGDLEIATTRFLWWHARMPVLPGTYMETGRNACRAGVFTRLLHFVRKDEMDGMASDGDSEIAATRTGTGTIPKRRHRPLRYKCIPNPTALSALIALSALNFLAFCLKMSYIVNSHFRFHRPSNL